MLQTQHDATWKSCVSARMKYIKQVNCEKWDHRLLEFLLFNAISWVNQAWKNPKPNGAGCGGSVWYLWRQRWGEGWTCHQGKCQQNRWYMIEMLQYILILYLDHSGPYTGIFALFGKISHLMQSRQKTPTTKTNRTVCSRQGCCF